MFDPACLYCGARYIQMLGMKIFDLHTATVKERREKVMTDWASYGHDRALIRELSLMKEWAVTPVESGESGRRKKTKPLPTGKKS